MKQQADEIPLGRLFSNWAKTQVAERGPNFATPEELDSILSDPMGWLELLKGYDAYNFVRDGLSWNDVTEVEDAAS